MGLETQDEIARLNNLAWLHTTLRRLGWPILDAQNEARRRFSGLTLSGLNAEQLEELVRWALDEDGDENGMG